MSKAAVQVMAMLALPVLLVGCQTIGDGVPDMSLEEARIIALNLAGGKFMVPPRTITDLGNFPKSLEEVDTRDQCVKTEPLLNKEQLQKLRSAYSQKTWQLRNAAERYYVKGSIENAILLQKQAVNLSKYRGTRSLNRVVLAIFLAEAGEFDDATAAYGNSVSDLMKASKRNESCRLRNRYMRGRTEGAIDLAKGEMVDAEKAFLYAQNNLLKAKETFGSCGGLSYFSDKLEAEVLLGRAQAVAWQGRLVEAETLTRAAYVRSTKLKPQSLILLSRIFHEQGRFEDAYRTALETLKIINRQCFPTNGLHRSRAQEAAARALIGLGRWQEALSHYQQLETDLANVSNTWERRFANTWERGLVLINVGRIDDGLKVLIAAYDKAREETGEDGYRVLELKALVALGQAKMGKYREALATFRETVPALVDRWRESTGDSVNFESRINRLRSVAEVYLDLLMDKTKGGDPADPVHIAESFRIANAVGARMVQKALNKGSARQLAKTPETEGLIRQQQDLEGRLVALRYRLNDSWNSGANVTKPLNDEVNKAEAALKSLNTEVVSRMPEYAALINPPVLSAVESQGLLDAGEALLSTYVGKDRTYVWAIPHRGKVAFAAADIGREDLADIVGLLRSALEPNAVTLGDIPEFDLVTAHDLYKALLEPVKAGWKEANSLLVVAHGPLGYLPLSVLPTEAAAVDSTRQPLFSGYRDVPWLARSHAVTVLPSVASLKTLRGLPPGDPQRKPYAGFGDPWFSEQQAATAMATPEATPTPELASRGALAVRGLPVRLRATPATRELDSAELARLPRLPDTADEIRSTALALNADLTTDVFLGSRANEGAVKGTDLSGYKVLAFATHGLVPGDLNGLTQPALALSAPDVANDTDNDGLLTMGEILGLKLDADWVVLSACNTGSGEGAGAEAVSGLGRAFFYAGTRALLVSNWPVETTSAKVLTTDLFKRQAANDNLTRAEALRQAMLGLIDGPGYVTPESGKTVFSYAHPIFWAPFSLIGDGGGGRESS